VNRALAAYRLMAYVVGVLLIVLVLVGIPLQFGAGHPGVVGVVGPIHGACYIIYLFSAANLARDERFSFKELLAIFGAGMVPFLAFVVERRVTHRVLSHERTDGEFAAPASGPVAQP
jgi:integral membrane protein